MAWWKRNNLRLIQTNLRATDAAMDRNALMERLKYLSANVLLLNTGGLVAFYPTELDFHYRSPSLGKGDLTGDMVRLCHDNGIRFMARFDLSKVHESVHQRHPEWAYRSVKGETINYNGMVHACINSAYQREGSLKILQEVVDRYPVDGIFFNMFGYTTKDYSNRYHGICQCDNCRAMFRERYGADLPTVENPEDELFRTYVRFKQETVREVLDSVRRLIKNKSEEIAISTYTDHAVDIIKKESNTEIHRPLPAWEYSASENIQSVEGSWDDKTISNVCINAIGLDYRFQGVPKAEVAIRLYQALAAGSGFDFCIIGVFKDYPDRKSLPVVRDLFAFHKKHEEYFGNFDTEADLVLIKPASERHSGDSEEYLGLFRMLKEEHLQFRVVEQAVFTARHAEGVKVVVCPDLVPDDRLLDELKKAGKALVWTGTSWAAIPRNKFASLFSIASFAPATERRWGYFLNEPKALFPSLAETDWTMLDGKFVPLAGTEGCGYGLAELSPGLFGPPELCGGHIKTGKHALLLSAEKRTMLLPFHPGSLFKRYGYDEHKAVVTDAIRSVFLPIPKITVKAPEYVEAFYNRYQENAGARFNVQLVNLSGFNGTSFHDPVPIRGIEVSVEWKGSSPPARVWSLTTGADLAFRLRDSRLEFSVGELKEYEAILIG